MYWLGESKFFNLSEEQVAAATSFTKQSGVGSRALQTIKDGGSSIRNHGFGLPDESRFEFDTLGDVMPRDEVVTWLESLVVSAVEAE